MCEADPFEKEVNEAQTRAEHIAPAPQAPKKPLLKQAFSGNL